MRRDAMRIECAALLASLLAAGAFAATPASAPGRGEGTRVEREGGMSLRGGQDGTAFRSLTVEGEDRVHFEFDRPALDLDLDPATAPGLEWGSAQDVLDRTVPDPLAPFVALSAAQSSPYLGRPWLGQFASGAVARFRPAVQNVERWRLVVADSRGQAVAAFEGRGQPPAEILWDGRTRDGGSVQPGLTYSYVFEAFDRAGNKRNFVGSGFEIPAYRMQSPAGTTLAFVVPQQPAAAPVLEAASWLNQAPRLDAPLQVTATARTLDQANKLAANLTRALRPHLLGDPARLQAQAVVEPDAPESGSIRIGPGR